MPYDNADLSLKLDKLCSELDHFCERCSAEVCFAKKNPRAIGCIRFFEYRDAVTEYKDTVRTLKYINERREHEMNIRIKKPLYVYWDKTKKKYGSYIIDSVGRQVSFGFNHSVKQIMECFGQVYSLVFKGSKK